MASMDKLKALREAAGVSQNGLATAIGKSHAFVWNVETGRKALTARETIHAWAEALEVHPDEVYRAIGAVPHDIIDLLTKADLEMWEQVRSCLDSDKDGDGSDR